MGDPKNTRALQAAFHVAESGSNDAAQAPGRGQVVALHRVCLLNTRRDSAVKDPVEAHRPL